MTRAQLEEWVFRLLAAEESLHLRVSALEAQVRSLQLAAPRGIPQDGAR